MKNKLCPKCNHPLSQRPDGSLHCNWGDVCEWGELTECKTLNMWISVKDKPVLLTDTDCLLLFENGEIKRLFEDDHPAELVTHWQPLPAPPNSEQADERTEGRQREAAHFLLNNGLDDLILNDRTNTKPEERIYVSDAIKMFSEQNPERSFASKVQSGEESLEQKTTKLQELIEAIEMFETIPSDQVISMLKDLAGKQTFDELQEIRWTAWKFSDKVDEEFEELWQAELSTNPYLKSKQ